MVLRVGVRGWVRVSIVSDLGNVTSPDILHVSSLVHDACHGNTLSLSNDPTGAVFGTLYGTNSSHGTNCSDVIVGERRICR